MTLDEIANELVDGCRAGRTQENLGKLYADDAVSIEANDRGGMQVTEGIDGIRGKHAWWEENFETVSQTVEGPFPHGDDRFAVIFDVEAREKASGNSIPMKEVAVYHVADGKIVREEFFYG